MKKVLLKSQFSNRFEMCPPNDNPPPPDPTGTTGF